ncbi:uncharacterized protein LOC125058919 isoform X1 [Pieris napi]|uniref:uncharacterized protein LOC125058919 isoform X1 n=1 Tax=Pieris napi TaxID=78633 RepID=UPI001FBB1FB4|nr:uncharacterized protein LOC125058919 isoform X1 [Pieris napi]
MSKGDFVFLLNKIGPKIKRNDTNMRTAISVTTRLAITLWFLATGDSFKSLMYLFRVSDASISTIIPEVCAAIIEGLKEYIKKPSGVTEWKQVAKDFKDRWNFPHCLGALDGKHVAITCPPNSGSQYYNYKQFYSIVLFAVTDARYNFLYVHAGVQGSISDGGVFRHTAFGKALLRQTLNIPHPETLPGREMLTPYIFLADDAFPLTENIFKPYTLDLNIGSPKRVCNYRISRARRIVENSFGILCSVFRILHTTIDVELKHVQDIVVACAHLHNFLRRNTRARSLYSPPGTFDSEDIDVGRIMPGSWRDDEQSLTDLRILGRNATTRAKAIRDEFMHYFMTEQGRVAWQDKYLEGTSSR